MQIITNCDNTISRMMEWGWRLSITWLWKEERRDGINSTRNWRNKQEMQRP